MGQLYETGRGSSDNVIAADAANAMVVAGSTNAALTMSIVTFTVKGPTPSLTNAAGLLLDLGALVAAGTCLFAAGASCAIAGKLGHASIAFDAGVWADDCFRRDDCGGESAGIAAAGALLLGLGPIAKKVVKSPSLGLSDDFVESLSRAGEAYSEAQGFAVSAGNFDGREFTSSHGTLLVGSTTTGVLAL